MSENPLELRQIALIVGDMSGTVRTIQENLGLTWSYESDGIREFGLVNSVLVVGTGFIEVVEPFDFASTGGRYWKKYGDGGYMIITHSRDASSHRARFEREGISLAFEKWYGDEANEPQLSMHFHTRETPGALVSIEAGPLGHWSPGGPGWRDHVRTGIASGLRGVIIGAADPLGAAAAWARALGREVEEGSTIVLDEGRIEFTPSTTGPDRLRVVELDVDDSHKGHEFEAGGVRFVCV